MEAALTLTAAAAGVTKLVDLVRNALDKDDAAPKWPWNVLPLAFGVAGAFLFNVDPEGAHLPDSLRFQVAGPMLHVAHGLMIGALASGWHEVFDFLSSKAKATHA